MSCSRVPMPPDELGQCVVGGAELRAVAVLEEDPRPDLVIDPAEVRRVDRQPVFVGLAGVCQNTERKLLWFSRVVVIVTPLELGALSGPGILTLPGRVDA